ncbi:hypothetical protein PoB_003424500 [Plakobranchus ocellatus]|uniref:Uncharacterized protein n=1 Tax=Plakobranchus ocellatus TaxID=259542 RepID=A0AAV4ALJ0_9GAST|nr:hypothetical protein PoB_003424500 [Plakobranchus ocellatus]
MSSAAAADANHLQLPTGASTDRHPSPSPHQQEPRYGGGQPQRRPSAAGSIPGRKRRGSTVQTAVIVGEVTDCMTLCVHGLFQQGNKYR